MKKANVLQIGKTRCDGCGGLAKTIIGDRALCQYCGRGPRPSLRDFPVELATQHKPKR